MVRRRTAAERPKPPLGRITPITLPDGRVYYPKHGMLRQLDGCVEIVPIELAFVIQQALDKGLPIPELPAAIQRPTQIPPQEIPSMTTPTQPPTPAPMVPATTTALVPAGLPFSPEEWGAMSERECQEAIAFFREENEATTEGLTISFPRVKYPTAGSSFWEIPTATGEPEAVKDIEGVVVFKQPVRAYWPVNGQVGNTPPLCSSMDGIVPVEGPGKQAPTCAQCPHSQWGSGKEGRGQACKARLNVFLLRPGEDIPTLVSLPPTAIKPFGQYAVQLRKSKRPLIGTTTIFGLTNAKNATGIEYKALALRLGRPLAFAEMKQARAIREAFEDQMARRGIAVDEATGDEPNGQGDDGASSQAPGF